MAKRVKSTQSEQASSNQIGPQIYGVNRFIQENTNEVLRLLVVYNSLRHRDSISKTHGINRYELWMLLSLSGYLVMHGKNIVSKDAFFDYLSRTGRIKPKFEGYLAGLIRLKCLGTYEYINQPGTLSLGVSDYGVEVIKAHFRAVFQVIGRWGNNDLQFTDFAASVARPDKHRPISA